ncbi:MAG TPA: hypothetical protein DEP48_05295 [Persephonella sp.]|uniref:Uncharacterized protein n=1 Tax=Persephonella marina (strain DSM 14350 / EX-H1) TaxID=123214 RepID=C0QPN4_PERMH|nr:MULTISPECIES: hypothetical protein [Persephonella]ACO04350.1 hypothetical protein PERMA_0843 [Persephonella marina EX-H1]HCB69755.1 hypothetical protein [Persephonella sp.]
MKIEIDLENLPKYRLEKELKRRKENKKIRYKRTRPRDPEKWKELKKFILSQLPPPEEILSGRYFRDLLRGS